MISSDGTIFSKSFLPTGIYSMKRTLIGFSFARETRSKKSSSFTPFMATQFIFVLIPFSTQRSIASKTFSRPGRLVIFSNFSGFNVSRLMFIFFIPAAFIPSNFSGRAIAFVVIPISVIPGRSCISFARDSIPRRTSGSPPVSLIDVIPSSEKSLARRSVSS